MTVAIITNDPLSPFQRQVIAGVRRYLEPHSYPTEIIETVLTDTDLSRVKLNWSALQGVIVISNALNDDALRELAGKVAAISLVSHRAKGLDIPAVLPDNRGGIRQIVRYLVQERGATRIAYIQGLLRQIDGQERWDAFQLEMMRNNLPLEDRLVLPGNFEVSIARPAVEVFMRNTDAFDAIVGADYLMAIAALEVVREHGVKVPQDAAIVGFGDGEEAAAAKLTTVGVDVPNIGEHAARQLLAQIQGMKIRGITLLATSIIHRET